jgi:hypothetical protein
MGKQKKNLKTWILGYLKTKNIIGRARDRIFMISSSIT